MLKTYLLPVLIACTPIVHAEPDIIQTKTYDVVILRPADVWSGDESSMTIAIESVKDKNFNYLYFDKDKNHNMGGVPSLFGGDLGKIPSEVLNLANEHKFNPTIFDKYDFIVEKPEYITPSELPNLSKVQADFYRKWTIKNGNPETLPLRTKVRHFFGNMASFVTIIASADKLGTEFGTKFAFDSGLTDDAYNLVVSEAKGAIVPLPLPPLDPSVYTSIELHRLTYGNTLGQILIGYKVQQTPEIEREALATGIASAAGVDTTPEAVAKAQEADHLQRQAIWDKCVASGECKK